MKERLKVATWNTEWRKPASRDAAIVRERLAAFDPDIVCLTETHIGFLDEWGGHSVYGSDDWGGPTHGTRREVLLWSRWPLRDLDRVGSPHLPPGRFAKATTSAPFGDIEVVGLVIPYHMSNVAWGTRDRTMWELHRLYLDALPDVTNRLSPRSIVMGDFNQRIPNARVPRELQSKLLAALENFIVHTVGAIGVQGLAAIDHIASGEPWVCQQVETLSNLTHEGRKISDHFGVGVVLSEGHAPVRASG